MNGVVHKLPIVILDILNRCNCRCVMCDIWKAVDTRSMTAGFVRAQLDDFDRLGVEWAVLTGGEPLMNSDVFEIGRALRSRGIRVTMLTSGLLLRRYARQIIDDIDDVIVSIDGPGEIHDRVRGIQGAFAQMADGVLALRAGGMEGSVAGRCTVQHANHNRLNDTVAAASAIGLRSVSFLAVDVKSAAFNRPNGLVTVRQNGLVLDRAEIDVLESEVQRLIADRPALLADSDDHLRRMVDIFRVYAGIQFPRSPRCNAPWVSAVVGSDGELRPCFFHRPISTVDGAGFANAVNAEGAVTFRNELDIESNETCKSCACSLLRK